MSFAEQLYLGLVLTAFASFAALVATLSWLDIKAGRATKARTKTKPVARPASSGKLGVGNAQPT